MMKARLSRIPTAVVPIAVTIGAITYGVGRLRARSHSPRWVMERQVEKIDRGTFEVINLPLGEWEKFGKKTINHHVRHKNPTTGKYTVVDIMTCVSLRFPGAQGSIASCYGTNHRRCFRRL